MVDGCGHVTKTSTGIRTHIGRKHPKQQQVVLGVAFGATRDAVTNPNRNGPYKTKRRKTKTATVITPETQAVDIPCILRVNIKGLKVVGIYPVIS